jgi:hypothetical protein
MPITRVPISIFFGIYIAIIFGLLSSSNNVYSQTDKLYTNPLFGFKFQYPSEWTEILSEGNRGVLFSLHELVYSTFEENRLSVFITELPENKTLKQYLMEYTSERPGINYESLKFNETKLSGLPAINATYDMTLNSANKEVLVSKAFTVFTVKDKAVYQIYYETSPELFNKWTSQLNNIISSFRII